MTSCDSNEIANYQGQDNGSLWTNAIAEGWDPQEDKKILRAVKPDGQETFQTARCITISIIQK